jgi:hypothetical protein
MRCGIRVALRDGGENDWLFREVATAGIAQFLLAPPHTRNRVALEVHSAIKPLRLLFCTSGIVDQGQAHGGLPSMTAWRHRDGIMP